MMKRIALAMLVAWLPGVSLLQAQEHILPPKSQLYFRFDGMSKHQEAFDKTALGKTLKGDTGKFLEEIWNFAQDNILKAAKNEPKVAPLLKDFTKVLSGTYQNGIALGVQADQFDPPLVQAVVVFPKGASDGVLLPLIQKIADDSKAPTKAAKVGKRFVTKVDLKVMQIGWWAQDNDAVVFVGTTDPIAYAKDVDDKKTGIASHDLYKKAHSIKEFTTCTRGYLDVASVLKVIGDITPPAAAIIDETGLNGLKSITFASGFDGPAERSIVDVDMPGPRKGLLSLVSDKKITLKVLPKMPKDVKTFSAGTINLSKTYDVLVGLVTNIVGIVAPNEVDNVKDGIKAFEATVGVDLSKDIFSNFGDVYVAYTSPSDGFFIFGSVTAVQVKDGKKMAAALQKLVKGIPGNPGGELNLKKSTYHGGEIYSLGMITRKDDDAPHTHMLSFGFHKDWFIFSSYPAAIKGFILRQNGDLPAWTPDEDVTKALSHFPKEFNSISVSDPRPMVQTLIGIAPVAAQIANIAIPFATLRRGNFDYRPFDLDSIPNPEEATRHFFPNVSVTLDNGTRIRTETRGSLSLTPLAITAAGVVGAGVAAGMFFAAF